jgi:hypothetical protein
MPSRTPKARRPARQPLWLLLALAAALFAPGSASGAAWVAPQDVHVVNGRTTAQPIPQLGVDSLGNAVLAMAAGKPGTGSQFVQVATRPVGGSWSPVTELGGVLSGPSLAVDPAGNAVVVWADRSAGAPCSGNPCLHIATRPAGASAFAEITPITNATNDDYKDPSVALDRSGNGDALVTWHRTVNATAPESIQAVAGTVGGSWSAPANVPRPATETPDSTTAAIDATGRGVIVWVAIQTTGGCPCAVRGAFENTRGTWTARAPAAPTANTPFSTDISSAVDGQGNVTAAWAGYDAGGASVAQTSTWDSATATWGSVATLASGTAAESFTGPHVVVASDGEAVAAWTHQASGAYTAESAVRSAGAWGAPQGLDSATSTTVTPGLAIDGAGNATVLWRNAAAGAIRFAVHQHGGGFDRTGDAYLAPSSQPAVAVADNAGHVHGAWAIDSATVHTAVYDPVPPTVATFSPPALVALVPSTFTLDASDIWSAPVTINWQFGDGQTADGASVTHTYPSAGLVQSRITATDSAGNQSAQTSSLQIADPPSQLPRTLTNPIASRTANLVPVAPIVLIKTPGSTRFEVLTRPEQVQVGSIIDARRGRVRITIANGHGGFDTADFYGGIFRFTQPKVKLGQTAFANPYLLFGSFRGCPRAPRNPKIAIFSKRKQLDPSRSVRHLWGEGHGAFRTVGRFSSATIRGTTWLTDDRCNGTLTKVTAGKVGVRDFVLRKTIVVRAKHRYLARPRVR